MNRFIRFLLLALCFSLSCIASPVLDLYDSLGVDYVKDCRRSDWLGYYQSGEDCIHLRSEYSSPHSFNHVALHELCHWSRAYHRLGDLDAHRHVPDCYEEVMCDLVAIALADELGVDRISNQDVADYVEMQLSNRRLRARDWQLIFKEAHRSLEYLLQRPYPENKLKHHLVRVSHINESILDQLG